MKYHKLLAKQIEKYLTDECRREPQFRTFINVVHNSYTSFERDKELLEHAAMLNEKEYSDINIQLKNEIVQRNESIEKLIEALQLLNGKTTLNEEGASVDLQSLVKVLHDQIAKQKEIENQLIEAKEAALNANKAKSDFLSIMSHEIRTPLNGIIGITQLLGQHEIPDDLSEKIEILKFSAENLHLLINDILDYSKIEAGKLELESSVFNLKKLISNIKKANQTKAEEKGIKIKLMLDDDIPDNLVGDQLRIGQVITNLVSNAVKFTSEGMVAIEFNLIKKVKDRATCSFTIKDTGIGIAKDKQEVIFNEFTQSNTSITRKYGGTGLGLVICKKILGLHGSKLVIESEENIGSTFSFIIDFQIAKESGKVKSDDTNQIYNVERLEGLKILLVEDYSINIRLTTMYFNKWLINFEVAENGLIALEKFEPGKFDIILMDLQMPEMDGMTATTEIRKLDTEIPILALTASANIFTVQKAIEVGMNDYISKPFHPNELIYKLLKHSGRI